MNDIKKCLLRSISEVHSGNREEGEQIVERFYDCFRHVINLIEEALAERTKLLEETLDFLGTCKEIENSRERYQEFDELAHYDLIKKINKVLEK